MVHKRAAVDLELAKYSGNRKNCWSRASLGLWAPREAVQKATVFHTSDRGDPIEENVQDGHVGVLQRDCLGRAAVGVLAHSVVLFDPCLHSKSFLETYWMSRRVHGWTWEER